jgi:hypothetical protein
MRGATGDCFGSHGATQTQVRRRRRRLNSLKRTLCGKQSRRPRPIEVREFDGGGCPAQQLRLESKTP